MPGSMSSVRSMRPRPNWVGNSAKSSRARVSPPRSDGGLRSLKNDPSGAPPSPCPKGWEGDVALFYVPLKRAIRCDDYAQNKVGERLTGAWVKPRALTQVNF